MWLGNPVQYKHYDELVKMSQCLVSDFQEWQKQHDLNTFGIEIEYLLKHNREKLAMPKINFVVPKINGMLKSFPLIDRLHKEPWEPWSFGWESSIEQARKCPGMEDLYINLLAPGIDLGDHDDDFLWTGLEHDSGKEHIEGFSVAFGINIPDPDKQYLIFDGVKYAYGTGEFVAFNGRHTTHGAVNQTPHWRVMCIMQISKEYWNV
jgi:hypothetical protein